MSFADQVVVITGAGRGLGRAHALGFAARGARVLVNDLGADGAPSESARAVVAEIEAAGGTALANGADVGDAGAAESAIAQALAAWGRVDVLVANAGILRDKSFAKMSAEEFELIVRVHLLGSANFARAVWGPMRAQGYGRIVLTSSASGVYGNFGQANYGAAKAAMIGLMNVLHQEGAKSDIRVNTLVPTAATAMTRELLPEAALALAGAGMRDAGGAVPGGAGRAQPRDHERRRRRIQRDAHRGRARRVFAGSIAHAGGDRGAVCGNIQHGGTGADGRRLPADAEIHGAGDAGDGFAVMR